jgi:predicted dehydrogenase
MWRHHPQVRALTDALADGVVGPVRTVRATFCFTLKRDVDVRLDPALDGGALMDVGCYCVSGARLVAGGEPESASAEQVVGPTGVDVRMAGVLRFGGGVLAELQCGFDLPPEHRLEITGERGTLLVRDPWHGRHPRIDLLRPGVPDEQLDVHAADPYRCQLEDFAAAVAAGREPLLGRADALGQARTIEALYASAATGETVAVGRDPVR